MTTRSPLIPVEQVDLVEVVAAAIEDVEGPLAADNGRGRFYPADAEKLARAALAALEPHLAAALNQRAGTPPVGDRVRVARVITREEAIALTTATPPDGEIGALVERLADEADLLRPGPQAELLDEAIAALEAFAAHQEEVEQVISAWAFTHNINGATRNDLFARLRARGERP